MSVYKKTIKSNLHLALLEVDPKGLEECIGEVRVSFADKAPSKFEDYSEFLCTVNTSPFCNCQTWSIGDFDNLFYALYGEVTQQEYLSIVNWVNDSLYDKNLLLLDLILEGVKNAKKLFGKAVRDTHKYESTNGNEMTLFFIDMRIVRQLATEDKKNVFKT